MNKIIYNLRKLTTQQNYLLYKENMKPLVSICLPTRNGAKTITKTIKSILSQKYNNYELLISINQSSDKTYLICKNFQARIKKLNFYSKKNYYLLPKIRII